ncbi:MAG: ATP-binding protein, partial [Saprospiraceae bacterium]
FQPETKDFNTQKYLIDIQHIKTEHGLANLTTTAICKDNQGFIWIATGYGLNRYDGNNFKLFTKEENGLYSNGLIHHIKKDEVGNLWIYYGKFTGSTYTYYGTEAIDIFNPLTEEVKPFEHFLEKPAPFKLSDIIHTTLNDPKNRVWIPTNNGTLFLYENGAFKKVFEQKGLLMHHITIDTQDKIWIGNQNELLCINRLGEILETVSLPNQLNDLWLGANDSLWLSTIDIKKIAESGYNYSIALWSKSKNGQLVPFQLTHNGHIANIVENKPDYPSIHRTRKGNWYTNFNRHGHIFNSKGELIFLEENTSWRFTNIFEKEDALWTATTTGVIKASVTTNPFELIHSRTDMLSDCRGITSDEKGNIYFTNTYVYQWNPRNRELKKLSSLPGTYALSYMDSLLWSSVYSSKYIGFDLNLKTGEAVKYPMPSVSGVYTLLKTKQPYQYLVGQGEGLAYIDIQKKKGFPFLKYNDFDTLKNSAINYIHQNSTGIWLATEQGVLLMNEQQGIIRQFNIVTGDLPLNNIRHIHEDEAGLFWLATKGGGIIKWQPPINGETTSNSQQFTTKNGGLSNDYIYAIYGDDYNRLWFTSDNGLMCMDKASFEVTTFLTENGLPHNEFNATSHYQAKDGTLYFGGLGGLISFHPKSFNLNLPNKAPLELLDYYVLEKDAPKTINKTKELKATQEIILKPTDKFIELHLALLDFENDGHHRYGFKIEGFSDMWKEVNQNIVEINSLPSGNYTLKIRGRSNNTNWAEKELVIPIKVLKPFYLQWWFLLGISGLVASGLAVFVKWRLAELEKKRQVMAIQELDKLKTRFFTNITHEFRTPLTLITGPLEQILPTIQTAPIRQQVVGVIRNAKHLLGLINQLLDLAKMEGGQMKVEVTHGDIIAYTQDLVNQLQPLAKNKQQNLSFLTDQKHWKTNFDEKKWHKIVYNLLSNAIKFTPEAGNIQLILINCQIDNKELIQLEVKDTGIGIEPNQLEKIFDRFHQVDSSNTRVYDGTGIGLALIKELIELQGGHISVRSELNKGTTFYIKIPVLETNNTTVLPNLIPTIDNALFPEVMPEKLVTTAVITNDEIKEKLKILIIEDNDEMRAYIGGQLDRDTYEIIEASNGIDGIEKAQAIIPDLIISDVMMPGKDGFEVTQTLRNTISTSHIPIILLTAKAALESKLEGLKRGADAYLTKPFSFKELTVRIDKLIETRQFLQQRFQKGIINLPENKTILPFEEENEFIKEIRAIIDTHLNATELNGAFIGKEVGMSRMQLHRKLKALINQSATELIKETRLQTAHQLLMKGEYNSSEVAYRTGFNTPAYFSSTFKKRFGISPSDVVKKASN